MRIDETDLQALLERGSPEEILRFAGRRALLVDAEALGGLREELVRACGIRFCRDLLGRIGFAHGQRLAESLKSRFIGGGVEAWRRAGALACAMQGWFTRGDAGGPSFDESGATWGRSLEAEQHVLRLGRAEDPVCWTLCGLAAGYFGVVLGEAVAVVEEACAGKGDTVCRLRIRPVREAEAARSALAGEDPDELGIVSRSPGMKRVMDLARTIARVDSTVFITGESGSGKERMARFVHRRSTRSRGPFIAVNCAAISESLLESELFGHALGAFTGAVADRAGLFEAAGEGTLFLDEVGEIPLSMQVKLLRVLQEREVRRVGENRSRPINVRIITATNRDLLPEVARKRFREDLYYRLNVVELPVPPLRDRKEDILPLADLFLREASLRMQRTVGGLAGPVVDRLLGHSWPGNVRELANAMERAVAVSSSDRIGLEDLPPDLRARVPGLPEPAAARSRRLADIEKLHILAVLHAESGNRTQAAKVLGIGSATLHRRLRAYRSGP